MMPRSMCWLQSEEMVGKTSFFGLLVDSRDSEMLTI